MALNANFSIQIKIRKIKIKKKFVNFIKMDIVNLERNAYLLILRIRKKKKRNQKKKKQRNLSTKLSKLMNK